VLTVSGWTSTVHELFRSLFSLLYPLKCGGCGRQADVALCPLCLSSFRVVAEDMTCPLCGRWLGRSILCGQCLGSQRGFDEGYYGFYYENQLREALHAFKFGGRKDVGRHLVRGLEERLLGLAGRFDCIIPLPVTEKRLRERGFNQSYVIGEEIGKITGKPVYPAVLRKIRQTRDQFELSRDERRKNVRNAFSADDNGRLKGKSVLLVDDLFTTGYTAKEASLALKHLKLQSVLLFALARTPP
jgi:competence protein ComFC